MGPATNSKKRVASKENEPVVANKVQKISADKGVRKSAKANEEQEVSADNEVQGNKQIAKAVRHKSFGVALQTLLK